MVATCVRKNKDGKHAEVTPVSNGSVNSASHLKQPLSLSTNRPLNGRQPGASVDPGRPARSTSAPISAGNSKVFLIGTIVSY